MRVLLSIHHYLDENQGAPGVTFQLAQVYRRFGISADILSLSDFPRVLRGKCLQLAYPSYTAYRLTSAKQPYDVVDLSSGDGWVYQSIQRSPRTLTVARSHGLEHTQHLVRLEEAKAGRLQLSSRYPIYHGGFRLWEVARSFRTADLSLFLNRTDRSFAVDRLGVNPGRAKVANNGLSDSFVGRPIDRSSFSNTKFKIALIGSYIHNKVNIAPTALNRLLGKYAQIEIGFFGTGKAAEDVLRDYSPEYHGRITVLKRYEHDSLPQLIAGYSVLLFPSLSEGFALSLYEAMACGLAVVCTRLPTFEERLCDGENVLFVPANDAGAIEAAIDRLITNPPLLRYLQQSGHARAQAFAWPRIARDTVALYDEFLARKLLTTGS